MEKKLDAIISDTLRGAIESINSIEVPREDIVSTLQNSKGQYVILFYQ